jgi:hypothetical protein
MIKDDHYSLLSKDMFDERFEVTKEELFSQGENQSVLQNKVNWLDLDCTFDKDLKRVMNENAIHIQD